MSKPQTITIDRYRRIAAALRALAAAVEVEGGPLEDSAYEFACNAAELARGSSVLFRHEEREDGLMPALVSLANRIDSVAMGSADRVDALPTKTPTPYSWLRRSLTTEHGATITLARAPTAGLLLVVDSTQDRRRVWTLDGAELFPGTYRAHDFEEVAVGDPQITADQLLRIERDHDLVLPTDARGWDLERLWGEP